MDDQTKLKVAHKETAGEYLKSNFSILKALIASSVNILIIAMIIFFLVFMEQGHVLPVAIFENGQVGIGINLLVLHLLLTFLSVLMSFFPDYLNAILFDNHDKKWYTTCFGLILYKVDPNQTNSTYKSFTTEKKVRLILSASIFIAWVVALLFIIDIFMISSLLRIVLFLLLLGLLILFISMTNTETLDKIYRFKDKVLYASIVLLFVQLILAYFVGWSNITIILEILLSLSCMFWVILFRYKRDRSSLSDTKFLHIIRCFGIGIGLMIFITNVSDQAAMLVNPINHLLLLLITIYTVIVLFIKGLIYVNYRYKAAQMTKYSLFLIRSIFIVLVGSFCFNLYVGNSLHRLNQIQWKNTETISTFYDRYNQSRVDTVPPIFYSAYGGGLMANYWNLLLFKELEKNPSFLRNTVTLSGVSGGSMGIANYIASKYKRTNYESVIQKVGSANILGLELSWLYGWDYIREMLPSHLLIGKDRSHRSMRYYAEIHNDKKLVSEIALDSVYKALTKNGHHFPNPIFNSTSTRSNYGVVSVIADKSTFPGSLQLDKINGSKELSFFEAASTSNRFPFISPAANIEKVGHFLDGGYFENSAMLSNVSFKKRLQQFEEEETKGDSLFIHKVRLVTVQNSKESYMTFLRKKFEAKYNITQHLACNFDHTEISAVLSGLTNIGRMPNYISSMAATNFSKEYEIIEIALPYYITEDDVSNYFGGELANSKMFMDFVASSNDTIKNILINSVTNFNGEITQYKFDRWGIVNPPTSRYLSEPVEIYMKLMAEYHPDVKKQIKAALKGK